MKKFLLILLGIVLFLGGICIMILPEDKIKVIGILGIFSGVPVFLYGLASPKRQRKKEDQLEVVNSK